MAKWNKEVMDDEPLARYTSLMIKIINFK